MDADVDPSSVPADRRGGAERRGAGAELDSKQQSTSGSTTVDEQLGGCDEDTASSRPSKGSVYGPTGTQLVDNGTPIVIPDSQDPEVGGTQGIDVEGGTQRFVEGVDDLNYEKTLRVDAKTQLEEPYVATQLVGTQLLEEAYVQTQLVGTQRVAEEPYVATQLVGTQMEQIDQETQQVRTLLGQETLNPDVHNDREQATQLVDFEVRTQLGQETLNPEVKTQLAQEHTEVQTVKMDATEEQQQATQLVGTQLGQEGTQALVMETDPTPVTPVRTSPLKRKTPASVNIESMRNSNFKAYAKLRDRILANPDEPLEGSALLLLKWGSSQGLQGLDELRQTSVVEESGGVGTCSAALALTPEPATQPSNNLLAMGSNNKSSGRPILRKETSDADDGLFKVKKVLFGDVKEAEVRPGARQDIVVSTALGHAAKGLSYLNSEDPGDESQGFALAAVDNFLQLNCVSQSQGEAALPGGFGGGGGRDEPPLALPPPPPAAYKGQVLPHAKSLEQEAAALYAWVDSQGNQPGDDEVPDAVKDRVPDVEPEKMPDGMKKVSDGKKMPDDNEKVPDGKKKVPDGRKKMPDDNEKVPDDKEKVPDAKKKVPDAKKKVPDHKKKMPDDNVSDEEEDNEEDDSNKLEKDEADTNQGTGKATGRKRVGKKSSATPKPSTRAASAGKERPVRTSVRKSTARKRSLPDAPATAPRLTRKRAAENNDNLQIVPAELFPSQTRTRRRRASVRVLFSRNIDSDTLELQKKTMKKLNIECADNASDCTHFVTDRFMRTTKMLEVVAAGKHVVTPQWLEDCHLAGALMDVKNYILQDAKKEKELGFCLTTTLSRAQRKPLFQDMTLYLTPKVQPQELGSIVATAGGKVLKEFDGSDDDCVVVSCEEDHELCVPLLKKGNVSRVRVSGVLAFTLSGFKVFSAEFLMSGIISYHLDFSRNALFEDVV